MGVPTIFQGNRVKVLNSEGFEFQDGKIVLFGSGTPEAAVAAPPGSLFMDETTNPAAAYIKETGTGNTGWALLTTGAPALPFVVIDAGGGFDYTLVATAINTEAANTLFYIRPGTYAEVATATMKTGQVLWGSGKDNVTIQGLVIATTDCELHDLTIDNDSNTGFTVFLGSTNTLVDSCEFIATVNRPVFINQSDKIRIMNSIFTSTGGANQCVSFNNCNKVWVDNCEFSGAGLDPLNLIGCTDVSVSNILSHDNINGMILTQEVNLTNSIFRNNSNHGIEINPIDANGRLNLSNLDIHTNTQNGIEIEEGAGITISNSNIHDNTLEGINIGSISTAEVNISNCFVDNNGANGIVLTTNATKTAISNTTVSNNTTDGISVLGLAALNIFNGNMIVDNTADGLQFAVGTVDNLYDSNIIRGNTPNLTDAGTNTAGNNLT